MKPWTYPSSKLSSLSRRDDKVASPVNWLCWGSWKPSAEPLITGLLLEPSPLVTAGFGWPAARACGAATVTSFFKRSTQSSMSLLQRLSVWANSRRNKWQRATKGQNNGQDTKCSFIKRSDWECTHFLENITKTENLHWVFFLFLSVSFSSNTLPSIGHENDIAQSKAYKCPSPTPNFPLFNCCLSGVL